MTKKESDKELQKVESASAMSPFKKMDQFFERDFFEEMDRFFESHLPERWGGWRHPLRWSRPSSFRQLAVPFEGKTPLVNVVEHDDEFIIKAELPGVAKEDLNITISNNLVTIEASTSKEEKEEKGDYYYREISQGTYNRTLMLPVKVKEDAAKAVFKNGVLELNIPKVEKTQRTTVKVE